jgi:hypothetical protein
VSLGRRPIIIRFFERCAPYKISTPTSMAKLRVALDRRSGEAQLPELILAVDAEVRFSRIMPGREPRSTHERLMVYAGTLAHGTALSAFVYCT